jgi:hypothetical protein
MSVDQEGANGASSPEEHEPVRLLLWRRATAVSAVLSVILSLPLLTISILMLTSFLVDRSAYIKNVWSMDFIMMAVMLIVSPLPIFSTIATMAFLYLCSARSRRKAVICLRLSLFGMTALIATGIAMAIEGERMGGDTGPLQVIAAVLLGVFLPTLVIVPSIFGLISLRRLKSTVSENE